MYNNSRYALRWTAMPARTEYRVICTVLFALATGISAQYKIFLPFSPVPVTMQTFVVLMSGLVMGPILGGASQLLNIILSITGVYGFAAGNGISVLTGPTAGYIVGFFLLAVAAGRISAKLRSTGTIQTLLILSSVYVSAVYVPGCIYLWIFMKSAGANLGFYELLYVGAIPFLAGDLLKIAAASLMLGNDSGE